MQRRTFVGGVLAGLSLSASRARAAGTGDIPKRVFGKTGEKLTIVGQAGGRFPLIRFEEAAAVVRRAVELGINYFDTARGYWDGRSEEVYGAVLPPFRKQVFITTKTVGRTRKEAEQDLHNSLRALKTDYIDLWHIHSVSEMEDVEKIFAPGGAIEAFEAARLEERQLHGVVVLTIASAIYPAQSATLDLSSELETVIRKRHRRTVEGQFSRMNQPGRVVRPGFGPIPGSDPSRQTRSKVVFQPDRRPPRESLPPRTAGRGCRHRAPRRLAFGARLCRVCGKAHQRRQE